MTAKSRKRKFKKDHKHHEDPYAIRVRRASEAVNRKFQEVGKACEKASSDLQEVGKAFDRFAQAIEQGRKERATRPSGSVAVGESGASEVAGLAPDEQEAEPQATGEEEDDLADVFDIPQKSHFAYYEKIVNDLPVHHATTTCFCAKSENHWETL